MVDHVRHDSRDNGLEALLILGTAFPLPQFPIALKSLQLARYVADDVSRTLCCGDTVGIEPRIGRRLGIGLTERFRRMVFGHLASKKSLA